MRGQTDVISVVIIAGIVITLVAAAYMWSIPLLSKSESRTTFNTGLDFSLNLNQKIIDLANTGGGEDVLDIPLGSIEIYPYGYAGIANNSIVYSFPISQPLALNRSRTYLGGASYLDATSIEGIFGESPPSVISLDVFPSGTAYMASVQTYFRRLVTRTAPVTGREIVLNYDSPAKLTGNSRITLTYDRNIQAAGITYTNIRVSVV